MSVGAILQIASYSVPQMIVGRIVAGIGNGINTSTAPVWQTETSAIKWRGKLVVIELILNIAGFSLSNWITYGFSFLPGPIAWRFPLAFQFVFIIILFATVPWLPESPRYGMDLIPRSLSCLTDWIGVIDGSSRTIMKMKHSPFLPTSKTNLKTMLSSWPSIKKSCTPFSTSEKMPLNGWTSCEGRLQEKVEQRPFDDCSSGLALKLSNNFLG